MYNNHMKIYQTDTQIEIKTSGLPRAILGIVVAILGIILAIAMLVGITRTGDGTTSPPWASLIGLIFLVVGVLLAFLSTNRDIILQRGGISSVNAKRVFGGQSKTESFDTIRVIAVNLSTHFASSNSSSSSRQRRSNLSLILDDNSRVEIANSSGSSFSFNGISLTDLIAKAPLGKEANQIAAFLGVPLQSADMTNPIALIKSVASAFGQPIGLSEDNKLPIQKGQAPTQTTQQPAPIAEVAQDPPEYPNSL